MVGVAVVVVVGRGVVVGEVVVVVRRGVVVGVAVVVELAAHSHRRITPVVLTISHWLPASDSYCVPHL